MYYREVQEEHVLTVKVQDRITPIKCNYARVVIKVQDYNDHTPMFLASTYNGTVLETAHIGTSITQVMAIDPDKESNGHVTYSVISGLFQLLFFNSYKNGYKVQSKFKIFL